MATNVKKKKKKQTFHLAASVTKRVNKLRDKNQLYTTDTRTTQKTHIAFIYI